MFTMNALRLAITQMFSPLLAPTILFVSL
jgi:hypothetical protein